MMKPEKRAEHDGKRKDLDWYNQEKTTMVHLQFVKTLEKELLNKLDRVLNKSGYIKELICVDIQREKD